MKLESTCVECAGSGGELVMAHELLDIMPCEAYLTQEADTAWTVCNKCRGRGVVYVSCDECGGSGMQSKGV